jgi:BirA family transcriptional regulator, biotin operon repressor / biotin---[acetyl-CoA-carboxylase] ligase
VGGQRVVVVGVGLNVAAPQALPGSPLPEHGLGTLAEIDAHLDAPAALARVALPLVSALQRFEREGWAPFAPAFARRDLLAGRPLALAGAAEALLGDGAGVDADGALLLRAADGAQQRIVSGEVSVRLAVTA